jgi:hypothetical protein
MSEVIDLGSGHTLRWLRWAPDDLPANRERYGFPLPVVERAGAVISHGSCEAAVHFEGTQLHEFYRDGKNFWTVVSWEPLTLSPSVLCRKCGDHGFIRDGRWVRA